MEPPVLKNPTTQRPTIEDVLRPPKQIIVDLGNATLPRSRGKTVNQNERPPLPNFVRDDQQQQQQPQQFVRWRSFNTGEKNKNVSKTSVTVTGLRPTGLDKLLAQEERGKEKVLKANNNSQNGKITKTTPMKAGERKTGENFQAQPAVVGKEIPVKNMDTMQFKEERENEKALEPHNDKNEEPPKNEGIFKAIPVKVLDQELDKEGGIFQARPAIALEENNNNNNAKADNEEIQKAINILLGAAKDHQGKASKQSAANASIVAEYATNNSPLQLNLSSLGSVIVISIANTGNMGNSMAKPSEADVVPQRRAKSSVPKTLTPFQRELERELKSIRQKSLENN